MTGLQIVVDGSGLERPRAGVGVYTTQILRAMSVDRPDCRLTVFGPPGAFADARWAVIFENKGSAMGQDQNRLEENFNSISR